MRTIIILFVTIFHLFGSELKGQGIPEINPSYVGPTLDFSDEFIKKFNSPEAFSECEKVYKKMEADGRSWKDLTSSEREILKYCDEIREDVWDVIGGACSWYCGGGPESVDGSSYLRSQGSNNYEPQNAHDLNFKNAWVEGVEGYGIGEYLTYRFVPESPRINKIIVVNGYVKSTAAWQNNSRVKKLKVYHNNTPLAILNLKDVRAEQVFDIGLIGYGDRRDYDALKLKDPWTLKFEILEVYKGNKYSDTAITELYFDGTDVHCFAKGTKILMADRSTKNIENLVIGDLVAYKVSRNQEIKSAKIEKLEKVVHDQLVTYKFESGLTITATKDHPFLIQSKEWASLDPYRTHQYEGFEKVALIEIGDEFIALKSTEKLIDIEYLDDEQITYTISKLSIGDNFIANGLIVGIEEYKTKNGWQQWRASIAAQGLAR